ncbi:MAG: hypothetical protein MUF23_15350 [Pirellula sp.]|nr:hypothetical protein [Pirellula sp.]
MSAPLTSTATITVTVFNDTPVKFFLANSRGTQVYRNDSTGKPLSPFASSISGQTHVGVASNLAGDRVWMLGSGGRINVHNGSNALLGSWQASGLSNPQDIATDGTDIWIVDAGSDTLVRFANAASVTNSGTSQWNVHRSDE